MALTIPPNVRNYSSPLNAVPLDWVTPPPEGAKGISCTITWNVAESGPNKAVYLNMQNNATLNFSEIRAVVVDNSANGSDVQVVFPDTETTFTIPAYTPYAIIPVFTNQTQFYMFSPLALVTDRTAFTILNTLPPPLAVPTTKAQNFNSVADIDATVSGSRVLVPPGVNGTLEGWLLTGFINASGTGGNITYTLSDGTGDDFFSGVNLADINTAENIPTIQATNLHLRFTNGLTLSWATLDNPTSLFLTCNVYYRTP